MTPTDTRIALRNAGHTPIPVSDKIPAIKAWQETPRNVKDTVIAGWARSAGFAIATGVLGRDTPFCDIDIRIPEAAKAAEDMVRAFVKESQADATVLVRTGLPPKRAIPFRTDKPFGKFSITLLPPNGGREEKIEFIAGGAQCVVHGPHPETGKPYHWHGGRSLLNTPRKDLPSIVEGEARKLAGDIVAMLARDHGYAIKVEPKREEPWAQFTRNGGTRPRHGVDSPWAQFVRGAGPYRQINELALRRLPDWVPALGLYRCRVSSGRYSAVPIWRQSSEPDPRKRNLSLSIHRDGIKDFGLDPPRGFTAIDLVMQARGCTEHEAYAWLCERLGGAHG